MRSLLNLLALLGRYGTQGFAASIFLGLALPQLASLARPLLGFTIFVFLLITFVRIEAAALKALLLAPGRVLAAALCLVVAPPAIVTAGVAVVGRNALEPGLLLGLAVLAAAPPIMSSPTVAMLLGLEPALILATVLSITVLSPVLSPAVASFVAGQAVPLDPAILVIRLVGLVGGSVLAAFVLRRALGAERVQRHKASFDGIGIVMYFVFAVAAMDGVLPALLGNPARVAGYLGIALAVSAAGFGVCWVLLRWAEPGERLVLGYATGQRNMGLLVAALGASTPETTYLFFALAQFPVYIAPQVIRTVAARLGKGRDD